MAEQQTPSSSTLLDALRRRLLPEVEPSMAKRLSDIGIGMLTSDSPSFFTALGQGLRNANEAENKQLQMLRQMVDSEEQSADRKARLELERAKQAYEQDPNNPRTQAYLLQAQAAVRSADAAMARANREMRDPWQVIGTDESGSAVVANMRDPSQRQTLSGVQPTPFGVASLRASGAGAGREDQNWLRALSQARQEAANNIGFSMLPQQEQSNWIDRRARQLYDTRPSQAGTPAAPAAPAAQSTTRLNLTGPLPPRQPTAPTE